MNTSTLNTGTKNQKMILSTLWVFAVLNYIYADVFTLFFVSSAQGETAAMDGSAALVFAVLMETAILMVLLARVLRHGANRWANILAGVIHTALVAWSLFSSNGMPPAPFYMFFAAIEIACTLFIIGYAWTWRSGDGQS